MFGLLTAFDGQVECAELLLGSATFLCHPVVNSAPNSCERGRSGFFFPAIPSATFFYTARPYSSCARSGDRRRYRTQKEQPAPVDRYNSS